jgi:hypothetical protein
VDVVHTTLWCENRYFWGENRSDFQKIGLSHTPEMDSFSHQQWMSFAFSHDDDAFFFVLAETIKNLPPYTHLSTGVPP